MTDAEILAQGFKAADAFNKSMDNIYNARPEIRLSVLEKKDTETKAKISELTKESEELTKAEQGVISPISFLTNDKYKPLVYLSVPVILVLWFKVLR